MLNSWRAPTLILSERTKLKEKHVMKEETEDVSRYLHSKVKSAIKWFFFSFFCLLKWDWVDTETLSLHWFGCICLLNTGDWCNKIIKLWKYPDCYKILFQKHLNQIIVQLFCYAYWISHPPDHVPKTQQLHKTLIGTGLSLTCIAEQSQYLSVASRCSIKETWLLHLST